MRNPTINPRFRVHPNGNATLSGVPADVLLSLVTRAELYAFEHPPKEDDRMLANRSWYQKMEWLARAIRDASDAQRRAKYGLNRTMREELRSSAKIRALMREKGVNQC